MTSLLAQAAPPAPDVSTIPLAVIAGYMALLLGLAFFSARLFRGTSKDYFVASHSIGPFMLLMSLFGTTMTAFALVGSTGKSFQQGIGVYGMMASASGLVHAACFFLIGIKVWAVAKRQGYVTQIQFFRDRFESNGIGYLLFPILVLLVLPYLLIGVIGSYRVMGPLTAGMFPNAFPETGGALPSAITGLVVCGVVLTYIFAGGSRAAALANTFQTLVFLAMGVLAFYLISSYLGGPQAAIEQANAAHLVRTQSELAVQAPGGGFIRSVGLSPITFLTYMFIPLSAGMFPHLFQHWLTARSAKTFRLTLVGHPLCIAILWLPCVLIGVWATGVFTPAGEAIWPEAAKARLQGLPDTGVGAVLSTTLRALVDNPFVVGMVMAGVLAAIMSSLDSQFLCLGTIFTNDIVLHKLGRERFSDRQIVFIARSFVVAVVVLTYVLSLLLEKNQSVFDLAIWCFSGFAALTVLVFAALYWKGATKAGAYASVVSVAVLWLTLFVKAGGKEYHIGGVLPVAILFAVGAVAMVGVSLFTKKPSEATIRKFFPEWRSCR